MHLLSVRCSTRREFFLSNISPPPREGLPHKEKDHEARNPDLGKMRFTRGKGMTIRTISCIYVCKVVIEKKPYSNLDWVNENYNRHPYSTVGSEEPRGNSSTEMLKILCLFQIKGLSLSTAKYLAVPYKLLLNFEDTNIFQGKAMQSLSFLKQ